MIPNPPRFTAEQLPVGESATLGSHSVSEAEIIRFASEWDSQYFHTDPAAAQESCFGGLIASGLHTLSIFQRLAVAGLFNHYDVVAGTEIREVRFLHPVRPGDVLVGAVHIGSVENDGRGRAAVVMTGTLKNQHGAVVLSLQMEALIASSGE